MTRNIGIYLVSSYCDRKRKKNNFLKCQEQSSIRQEITYECLCLQTISVLQH